MKRARFTAAMVAASSALSVGCGHTDVYEALIRPPSRGTGRPAEVYMAPAPPPRAYADVAMIQVIGFGADANLEDTVRAMTLRAEQLGCDAVVQVRVDTGATLSHGFGVCANWVAE